MSVNTTVIVIISKCLFCILILYLKKKKICLWENRNFPFAISDRGGDLGGKNNSSDCFWLISIALRFSLPSYFFYFKDKRYISQTTWILMSSLLQFWTPLDSIWLVRFFKSKDLFMFQSRPKKKKKDFILSAVYTKSEGSKLPSLKSFLIQNSPFIVQN